MPPPTYLVEQQYAVYTHYPIYTVTKSYEVESPETQFETQVFRRLHEGKKHLYREEYGLALDAFRELRQLILRTVNPQLPPQPSLRVSVDTKLFLQNAVLEPLLKRTAEMIRVTPTARLDLPDTIFNGKVQLPERVSGRINNELIDGNLSATDFQGKVGPLLASAKLAAGDEDFAGAIKLYQTALRAVPRGNGRIQASLHHDIGLLKEKAGDVRGATTSLKKGVAAFGSAEDFSSQVTATRSLAYLQQRQGQEDKAKLNLQRADQIVREKNLHALSFGGRTAALTNLSRTTIIPARTMSLNVNRASVLPVAAASNARLTTDPTASTLIAEKILAKTDKSSQKTVFIASDAGIQELVIDRNGAQNIDTFLKARIETKDLSILTGYLSNPVQMVAYLPHLYFYVLPIAMGDCFRGLGRYELAERDYLSTLQYPYLNKDAEVVHLWIRLAEVTLERGDRLYRQAGDNANRFAGGKKFYQRLLKLDGTLMTTSPLYRHRHFHAIRDRIARFIQPHIGDLTAPFGSDILDENPEILTLVLEAKVKLTQMESKLNFFGFGRSYIPPFTFEHLQATARYFAQQASQIEAKYIQFKSTAENEELRYEQLDQQVEVARQSVRLEELGVAEAREGLDVAQATRDYADTRRENAIESRDNFNDVRWELLELERATAWSSAAVEDEDDEIKQTWNGHYYNSNRRRRSMVLYDLANQKGRINHDLQAANLQNAVEDATAYRDMARQQVEQSLARVRVAMQRQNIAELQQRQAEENREFLQLKEFGASQWYRMAKLLKRLARKYLDQATEIAMLTQRAYNAETERNVRPIRYDYVTGRPGGLLGADQLLQGIDYFSFDMVTNVRARKAPVKRTFSMADHFPFAFNNLIQTGKARFHTRLRDFDRQHPGLYGCKIKNVELIIVGITRATSIAGSLRNAGGSRFRRADGTVVSRTYPADVMPLSQYDFRNDALAFRFEQKDLRLFENHGVATLWELNLPLDANDFDLNEILDVQLVVYYNGFHSSELERNIREDLPTNGRGSTMLGLRLQYPDERFYLRNRGSAVIEIGRHNFPANLVNLQLDRARLKLAGDPDFTGNLNIRVHSANRDAELELTTDASGRVSRQAFTAWLGEDLLDTWSVTISPEDNPDKMVDGTLPLDKIDDLFFFLHHRFDYRS